MRIRRGEFRAAAGQYGSGGADEQHLLWIDDDGRGNFHRM
jgi:hypothetical protein